MTEDDLADDQANCPCETCRHYEAVNASLLAERLARTESERDAAYRGRAELVALIAHIFPSMMHAGADPNTPGWPVLFVNTPEGQLSWHINPADLDLFDTENYGLMEDEGFRVEWDGHTDAQKSERIKRLTQCWAPEELTDQSTWGDL